MKFIPKELEANVIASLESAMTAAGLTKDEYEISGTWKTVANGYVRWIESGTTAALVFVSVATSVPRTFTNPSVDFLANVELFIRPEKDASGDLLVEFAKAIENTIRTWQSRTYQQAFEDLDVAGEFAVGSIAGAQGSAPTVQDGRCYVSWPITISGSYIN